MQAYAIVIQGHSVSENGFSVLTASSRNVGNSFEIQRFEAITPTNVNDIMKSRKLVWNYPDVGSTLDPWTGLRKTAYGGRDPKRRVACAVSHYLLWQKCIDIDQPILVLEHDAVFIKKFDPSSAIESSFGVVGINNPINATFMFGKYHELIQSSKQELMPPPMLVSKEIPQGLAGNSAYLIKPSAATSLIRLVHEYGLWPNDAIMCQQLCDFLGVSKTYYTQVQNLKSTTSL